MRLGLNPKIRQGLSESKSIEVGLSKISEDAIAIGAAIYTTTKWFEKKSTKRVTY